MTKQTQKLIRGTLILTIAGILAKVISAFYKVPLERLTDTIGLGYYQAVYPLYSILTAAALIGIPNSVSKLVAEEIARNEYRKAHETFKIAFYITGTLGVLVSIVLYFGAEPIIEFHKWQGSFYALRGLSLAPLFIAAAGAIRGYMQGMQIMMPTAISQIIESVFKVIFGIGLVYILKVQGMPLEIQIGGAALGVSMGLSLSAVFLVIAYIKRRKSIKRRIAEHDKTVNYSRKSIAKTIAYIAVPITVASASYSIMLFIDTSTVSKLLTEPIIINGSLETVGKLLNGVFAKVQTIINVPLVISISLIISIVPSLSTANVQLDKSELWMKIKEAIGMAVKLALPAAVGIAILAKPILNLVYKEPEGYQYLEALAIALFFMILAQTMIGILQGLSKYYLSLFVVLVAAGGKVIVNLILITPMQGYGAIIGTIVYYVSIVIMAYTIILRETGLKLVLYQLLVKPITASFIMGISTYLTYKGVHYLIHSNTLATLMAVLVGIAVYGIAMILLQAFTKDEIMILPKHQRIIRFLEKRNLI